MRRKVSAPIQRHTPRLQPGGSLSEADVTRQIRDVLKRCKVFHWKNWSGPMTYPKGIADILGIYQGRLLAIEVKAPHWKPPQPTTKQYKHYKEQEDFLFQVRENGGIGFFAQSVDEVVEELGLEVRLMPLFTPERKKGNLCEQSD